MLTAPIKMPPMDRSLTRHAKTRQVYNPSAKEGGVWYTLDQCTEENTRVASQVCF